MRKANRIECFLLISGMSAMLLALLCNRFFLAYLFSDDHEIEFPNSALILSMQFVLASWGTLIIISVGKHPRLLSFLFGCALSACIIAVMELAAFMLLQKHDYLGKKMFTHKLYVRNMHIGYRLLPRCTTRSMRIMQGDTLYEALYHINKDGWRRVPVNDSTYRERFLALFGGSYVFGEGLNDDQTSAFFLQKAQKCYEVYNFGTGGYGTNQVYTLLRDSTAAQCIKQPRGIGMYIFVDDHLFRNIGSMRVYNLWGRDMPYYFLRGDSLIRSGTFTTGRRLRSFIYNLLGRSNILKAARFDWPLKADEDDLQLTARLIEACASSFRKQFPGSRFIVLFYPGSVFAKDIIRLMKQDAAHLTVLDYSALFDRQDDKYIIPKDTHPSAYANQLLVNQIMDDLGLCTQPISSSLKQ